MRTKRWCAEILQPQGVPSVVSHTSSQSSTKLQYETELRKAILWFALWRPTTLSLSTIQNIVRLAMTCNVGVEDFILQTPPDGLCLYYSLLAAQNQSGWRYKRSPLGFQRDRALEEVQSAKARKMRADLIQRYYDLGNNAEAERLQLPGYLGYPGAENLDVLADMFSVRIELHSLTFDQMPTQNFGSGTLVRIGHVMLLDATGSQSGHYICLRTEPVACTYALPSESSAHSKSCSSGTNDSCTTVSSSDKEDGGDADGSSSSTSSSSSTTTRGSSSKISQIDNPTLEDMLSDVIDAEFEQAQLEADSVLAVRHRKATRSKKRAMCIGTSAMESCIASLTMANQPSRARVRC